MIRFAGRMARGVISAVITLAVVVGGPWALVYFFGSPIPTSIPDGDAVSRWVNDPLSSTSLRGVVMVVLWLAWAVFVWILTVETYAAIRRIRAPRIRLAAPLHGVAAGLVGATATALTGGAGQAAPPAATPGSVATAEIPDLAAVDQGPAQAVTTYQAPTLGSSSAGLASYRVVPGDWMVGIADRFLGDPDAYTRLAVLNPQLAADPRFPDHIEPGWDILLPADAVDYGPRRHATGPVIPAPTPPPADDTPTATAPDPADPAGDVTVEPTPAPGPSATAAPAPSVGSTYPYYPTDDDDVFDDADTDRIVAELDSGSVHVGAMSGAGLLASLVLLALQAERRRQTQYRRPGQRLPNPRGGQTERELRVAETPADVERLDLALRHLAAGLVDHPRQPDTVGVRVIGGDVQLLLGADCEAPPEPWLDEGSHWVLPGDVPLLDLPGHARPLPSLTAVGSRAGRHLLLDLERHGVLSIVGDRSRATDLLRYMVCELACSTWSEDAEITIAGFGDAESALLRELNWHRVGIAVDVTDAIGQLRRHITATRQALDALNLPDTVTGRVREVAADAWTPHLLLVATVDDQTRTQLTALHHDLVAAGRCAVAAVVVTADQPPIGPAVTVSDDGLLTVAASPLRTTTGAARLAAPELDKLAEILRLARATELDSPSRSDDTAPRSPGQINDDQPADEEVVEEEEPIDGTAVVSGLYDPTTWTSPSPDLGQSAVPQTVTTPTRRSAPTPGDALDADLHHWHAHDTTRPRIAILGPVSVTTFGRSLEARTPFHTEIVVYLATHPRGADRYELEEAFWPDKEIGQASLKVAMARTRSWLGAEWLEDANRTRIYRLTPGYLFDWNLFGQLTARAKTRGQHGVDDRRAALELVRGRPLYGADAQTTGRKPYTWLADSVIDPTHLVAVIVDTAHELAEDYLAAGDTGGVRWAVSQAWTADPDRGHDEPWVDLMKAERSDGHRAELRQLHDQLLRARDAEVLEDLAPATYREVQKLLRD